MLNRPITPLNFQLSRAFSHLGDSLHTLIDAICYSDIRHISSSNIALLQDIIQSLIIEIGESTIRSKELSIPPKMIYLLRMGIYHISYKDLGDEARDVLTGIIAPNSPAFYHQLSTLINDLPAYPMKK